MVIYSKMDSNILYMTRQKIIELKTTIRQIEKKVTPQKRRNVCQDDNHHTEKHLFWGCF